MSTLQNSGAIRNLTRCRKNPISSRHSENLILPQSLDAEQAVLGAMLISEEAVQHGRAMLTCEDFYRNLHQTLFQTLLAIDAAGAPVDLITTTEQLRREGNLEKIGGFSYLTAIVDMCPVANRVEKYAQILLETSMRRRVIACAEQISRWAYSNGEMNQLWQEMEAINALQRNVAGAAPARFRLIPLSELRARPKQPMLVEDVMPIKCIAALVGASGTFKSFIALDMCLSVAAGIDWQTHKTHFGPVVYVAGEGSTGMSNRADAWLKHHRVEDAANFYLIEEAPQMMQPEEVNELLCQLKSLPELPCLIVLDTLARCLVNGDENNSRDMGLLIAGAERIRRETGATVLVIHHYGHSGRSRGSTAFPAGVDTKIDVRVKGDSVILQCDKQKDGAPFPPICLKKQIIDLEDNESSLVFVLDGASNGDNFCPSRLSKTQERALEVLRQLGSASWSDWRRECENVKIPTGTFKGIPKTLKENGLVKQGAEGQWYGV